MPLRLAVGAVLWWGAVGVAPALAGPAAPVGSAPAPGTVQVSWSTFDALRPTPPPAPDDPRRATATHRTVRLTRDEDGVAWVDITWHLDVPGPTWLDAQLLSGPVVVESVWVDGRPGGATVGRDTASLAHRATGPTTVRVLARPTTDPLRHPLRLDLMPAAVGQVLTDVSGHTLTTPQALPRLADVLWTGRSSLDLRLTPTEPAPATPRRRTTATVRTGLTVSDGEARVQARVTWRADRGDLGALVFSVPEGVDAALDLPPGVSLTTRGRRQVLTPDRAGRELLTVTLSWSHPLTGADTQSVPLPELRVERVDHIERTLALARDTDLEVVPTFTAGRALAPSELTADDQALVDGTITAARRGEARGRVQILRYVPAELPPLLVDVATFTVGLGPDGSQVVQGELTVRNERGTHLVLTVPEDLRLVAVTVDDDPVAVSPLSGGRWRIPLPRSVETLQGPLAFPVGLSLLGRERPILTADEPLVLPTVDAPIALRRVAVHLPRHTRLRPRLAPPTQVDTFEDREGLAYGFGGGAAEERARDTYREAVDAWMRNDFGEAQAQLDTLGRLGVSNANVTRLQSNLDGLVTEGTDAPADPQLRRLKDQARARSAAQARAQDELLQEAEAAEARGDYAQASQAYTEALSLADDLALLEPDESVEQERRVARARKAKKSAEDKVSAASQTAAAGGDGLVDHKGSGGPADRPVSSTPSRDDAHAFGDVTVQGALVQPDGEAMASPVAGDTEDAERAPPPPAPPRRTGGEAETDVVVLGQVTAETGRRRTRRAGAREEAIAAPVPEPPRLGVSATEAALVVPTPGPVLRFEQALVPADDTTPLTLPIHVPRRSR